MLRVAGGEGAREPAQDVGGGALVTSERFAQPVNPRAPGFDQPVLDLSRRHLWNRARCGRYDEVDAGQSRLIEVRGVRCHATVEGLLQHRCHAPADLGAVAVARQKNQTRRKPLERVAQDEQGNARALLEMQDPKRDLKQLPFIDLEQFVTREGVEDMLQRPSVIAVRGKAGALLAAPHLLPQQWDLIDRLDVRGPGEQAEHKPQTCYLTRMVEGFYDDGAHRNGPMNGGRAA